MPLKYFGILVNVFLPYDKRKYRTIFQKISKDNTLKVSSENFISKLHNLDIYLSNLENMMNIIFFKILLLWDLQIMQHEKKIWVN